MDLHLRNYWRRALIPLRPCPFNQKNFNFRPVYQAGERSGRQGLLSYSLYGNYQRYLETLRRNLIISREELPEWQIRVYLSVEVPATVREKILQEGGEIVVMGPDPPKGHEAALWRFLPASQDLPFLCLDADDVIQPSLRNHLQAWLSSKQPFCNLTAVTFMIPITANSWGSRNQAIPDIQERISRYCEHWYGFDEAFLKAEVWPLMQSQGCWSAWTLPLDQVIVGYIIVLIALIVYSISLAWSI